MPETPTTYWPDLSVEFHFVEERSYAVREVEFSNRRRQASIIDGRPQRRMEGRVPATTYENEETIRDFLDAHTGPFVPFYVFEWPHRKHTGTTIIASFDGSTMFPPDVVLPFKASVITQVYDDGVAVGSFGFSAGTGPGGEDEITEILSAPAEFSVITADLRARERIAVKYLGKVARIDHPLREPQGASKPAYYYSVPLIEVF